jgi:hypothetical protein
MALTDIKAVQQLTINSDLPGDTGKDIAKIVELKVLSILTNNKYLLSLRNTMTGELSGSQAGGTFIYRQPSRVVMGTDYDPLTGITKQFTSASTATLVLDQHLTIDIVFEDFDMDRYAEMGSVFMNEWISSAVKSFIMCIEAIFLRALKTYYVATYDKNPDGILVFDSTSITNADKAREFFNTFRKRIIKIEKHISKSEIGVDTLNAALAITPEMSTDFTTYLPGTITTDTSIKAWETGKLLGSIMGVELQENNMLNEKFEKGTAREINKDITFDLTGLNGVYTTSYTFANPLGIDKTSMVTDNNTLNLRFVKKSMGSIPGAVRPWLGFIVMDKEPTKDEINAAKLLVYGASGVQGNRYEAHFQALGFDPYFTTTPVA